MKVTELLLIMLGLVAVAHSQKDYQLQCSREEMGIRWPSYKSNSEYYVCHRLGDRPMIVNCNAGQVFTFVLQVCTSPSRYIPAPPLDVLPISSPVAGVPWKEHGDFNPLDIINGAPPPLLGENQGHHQLLGANQGHHNVLEIPHPPMVVVDAPKPQIITVTDHNQEDVDNNKEEEQKPQHSPAKPHKPIAKPPMPPTPAPTPPVVDNADADKKPLGKKPTAQKKTPTKKSPSKPGKGGKKAKPNDKAGKKSPKKSPKKPVTPAKKAPKAPTKA